MTFISAPEDMLRTKVITLFSQVGSTPVTSTVCKAKSPRVSSHWLIVSVFTVVPVLQLVAAACPTPRETTPSVVELFPRSVIATEAITPVAVTITAKVKRIVWGSVRPDFLG